MTEHQHQCAVIEWADLNTSQHPELRWLHAIPNGGGRSKAEAGRLKAEGVRAGVFDLCLPYPRSGKCGLFIEMKRRTKGKVSEEQRRWHERLRALGYQVEVCKGFEEAQATFNAYLEG